MTKYTVAIKGEADGPTAKSTDDLDDALDWYTNACTAVMDPEEDLQAASLAVVGVVWAIIQENGVGGDGPGEVVELQARKVA